MADYEAGYDPKYGYNRNAFAHKTFPQAVIGRIVKLIVTPIGLVSEAVHNQKEKKERSESQSNVSSTAESNAEGRKEIPQAQNVSSPPGDEGCDPSPVYVEVSDDQANELIATQQAVPADGKVATHELVREDAEIDGIERDEADWVLDEVASDTEEKANPKDDSPLEHNSDLVQDKGTGKGKGKGNSSKDQETYQKLPFPVILPQRRPGTKARGFIRAYAPALGIPGIDQKIFLTFLKDFHQAAQASPIFDVIMIATAIAGAYPDIMVGLAIQAVQIAAAIGQEVQERWRTNKFLDQANRDIFIPKGLIALIVTYRHGDSEQTEIGTKTVDIGASAVAKYGAAFSATTDAEEGTQEKKGKLDETKEKMRGFRIASGETHGEAELPVTCAPLIFPALDAAAAGSANDSGPGEGVMNSIKTNSKSASKFVSNYLDRRAQATYVSSFF